MVNIGIVGLGYWGPNLVRNFSRIKDVKVKYICDLSKENIENSSYMVPEAVKTDEYEKLLSDQEIDAVVIATSAPTHAELVKKALLKNKHAFVEKPLALTVAEGQELVRLSEDRKLILMVGHLMVYHPAVNMMKVLVESEELGKIYYLYSQRLNLGRLRKDENVVWSLAPHDISMILYLKESRPVEVICTGGDYLRDRVEDVAFITIRFEDGSLGHAHVSWLDPHKIRKLTIVGSDKMAVFDDMESTEKIRIFDKGVEAAPDLALYGDELTLRFGDIVIPFLKMQEPLFIECQHFIDCVVEGKKPVSDGRSGLEVLKVLDACDRSLASGGKAVEIA